MHICYLTRGSFTHIQAYVDFFRSRGHRVSLIHLDPHPVPGAENRSAALGAFDPVRGKWKIPLQFPRVLWHVRRLRPDVLHAHYATSGGLLGAMTGFGPLVVSCHGSDVLYGSSDLFRRPALKWALGRARVVHVVSNELREQVLSLGARPERIVVSNVGVPTEALARAPRRRGGGTIEILCTRRLEPVYDVENLLRALVPLTNRIGNFRCTIAGGGPLEPRLRDLARELGLGTRVRFLGGFDPGELPELLGSADVYVTCAVSDGTSLSLLEGMAGGLFPVATDIPANREWITSGDNGLLFRPRDADGLAKALERACREGSFRRSVAARNLEIVRRRGDREHNLADLEVIYRRIVGSAGGAHG